MAVIAISNCFRMSDYLESVRRAGGLPFEVAAGGAAPEELLGQVDGVVLTGGGDVDPSRYGERPHSTFEAAEPGRDEFEMALVKATLAAGKPLLAICRGMQVLNVACGGSLVQDIPSQVPGALAHSVSPPRNAIAHTAALTRGSRLHEILGDLMEAGDLCPVNSRHHQSVARVAAGLEPTAIAIDGVIEGIERPGPVFCVGVQWHPENFWETGEFQTLFDRFVQEAVASAGRDRRT